MGVDSPKVSNLSGKVTKKQLKEFRKAFKNDDGARIVQNAVTTTSVVNIALSREVVANTDYVGEGYGLPAESTIEAIDILARQEGILLDPVYSGKGMAGLVDLIRKGYFKTGENVVFVHTCGSVALFGYTASFNIGDKRAAA